MYYFINGTKPQLRSNVKVFKKKNLLLNSWIDLTEVLNTYGFISLFDATISK